jgi:DNA-binding NarL/FixJ family response regulator
MICGMGERLRAVVAEDNLLVRQGLCSLLAVSGVVDVRAACSSLPELLEAVEVHDPDVVLTDIRMPPGFSDEGVQAARQLRESHPGLGVVVISQFADPGYAMAVLGDGSDGRAYMLKDRVHDLDRLLAAIRAVVAGASFVDEEIVAALVRSRARLVGGPTDALTEREREVLTEVATGASNASIAESLGVSAHAVEKHINSIFAKLGLADGKTSNRRVQAVLLHLHDQQRGA